MAMTKAERLRMETLDKALRLARALHWPTYAEPAPMTREEIEAAKVPGGTKYGRQQMVALGWFANSYSRHVERGCSNGVNHGHGDKTSAQGMGQLFRTEADAWRFIRCELTREYAERLAAIDAEAHVTLNLSIPEQQALGMEMDAGTIQWWHDQEAKAPGAWARATSNPYPIRTALEHVNAWITWATGGGDALVWCHGATFDCPLLAELYRRAGVPCPWQFWSVRDTRTLYDLAGINPKEWAVPPPHVALNDAIGQTRAANAALAILARAHQPVRRYFFDGNHNAVLFTDDGSQPADPMVREIQANEYAHVVAGAVTQPADRRRTAEGAISNAEMAAQMEIKDTVLRGALIDNVAAAFVA
jgi:hypothetical protein